MRAIRALLVLVVIAIVGLFAYNYWTGNGWTLHPAENATGVDAEAARQRVIEAASKTATTAGEAATHVESALSESALTAKIKSKMVLDDYVKARTINVDTHGSVVTLRGVVESASEHDRAVRLAKETLGVTEVVDKLEIRKH